MKRKNILWAVLCAGIVLVCAGWILLRGGGGTIAVVYSDGEPVCEIDLSAVDEPYEFTVESEWGYNIIHVEKDGIGVRASDCPEQTCVNQGLIHDSMLPVICLPHRLVIKIEEPDA